MTSSSSGTISDSTSNPTTTLPTYSSSTLDEAWSKYLSTYPPDDCKHIYGFDDPDHELSKLQKITTIRILDYQNFPPSTPGSTTTPPTPISLLTKIRQCHPALSLAAEFKRASPSKGDINPDLDPATQASLYADAGASIISILTEERHFKGSLADLTAARAATSSSDRPVILRKDFIFSRVQIHEAVHAGADTVLLIVAVLPAALLADLITYCRSLGMEPLVEIHGDSELSVALAAGARVIGVNNRNLHTFEMDLGTTDDACAELTRRGIRFWHDGEEDDGEGGVVVGALSGMSSSLDVDRYRKLGVGMVLVGESLMRASDVGEAIRGLCLDPRDYESGDAAAGGVGGSYTGGTKLVKVCGVTNEEDALVACRAGASLIGVIFAEKSKRKVDVDAARGVVDAVRRFGERTKRHEFVRDGEDDNGDAPVMRALVKKTRALEEAARRPLVVGVFQNQDEEFVRQMVEEVGLDLVQLHGKEGMAAANQERCGVPAIRVVDIPVGDGGAPVEAIMESFTNDPMAILLDTTVKSGSDGGGTGQTFDWNIVKTIQDKGLPVIIAGGLKPDNIEEAVGSVRPWGVDVSSGVEMEPGKKDHDKVKTFVSKARMAAVESNKGF
eukprot:CAMPEP_0172490118 /NCGR_PEP_ID=MMETSP1066-20121228/20459_1 /TAXON_ID=671091 /ORGANISM="Coscinodiscus wailesii, Strain CCMP2513" /LENGTH=613 /DNA_ID=CAMNT_0013258431 /DNA_START=164 /DNA_END=2005 /DNA_ORIENTATION=-